MNLEKEIQNISIGSGHLVTVKDAINITKQYAEQKCKEQKNLILKEIFESTTIHQLAKEPKTITEIIKDAPLATEGE